MVLPPLEALAAHMPTLTKTERSIAEFILNDPVTAYQSDTDFLANETGASKAAFIRLCQKIGYKGYSEFRFALSRSMVSNTPDFVSSDDPIQKITYTYAKLINQISETLDINQINNLADKILNARRLKIFGSNRTYLSAQQLRMRLGKIGLDAEAIGDEISMRDISELMTEDDCLILFSIKGMEHYLSIINLAKLNNCPVTLLTMTAGNKLEAHVDQQILLPIVSRLTTTSFLDDQVIYFVFIEILLNVLAKKLQEQ